MKNSILLFLVVIFSFSLFAQNWSPIRVNEKMNYQHSDSAYISHTIWVDTMDVTGSDTTYFLNKIVTDHPTDADKVLRNQPQFLYSAMINLAGGLYHFADPGFYILQTWAGLNDTWIFDLDSNTTAEVIYLTEIEIFGMIDSVKVISLSDGNEIQLSKNFGIISFPDFKNGGVYELVGIQDTEYGESVPGFWEIFDFEVGDVFQYEGTVGGGGAMFIDYYTQKFTITEKEIQPDQVTYSYAGYRKGQIWEIGSPPNVYGYSDVISGNLIYPESEDIYANLYSNQFCQVLEGYCPLSYDDITYVRCKIYMDTNQVITKQIGFNFNENFNPAGEHLAVPDEFNDTLMKLTDYFNTLGVIGTSLKNNLGVTEFIAYYFEDEDQYRLEGYIKDGDTVGTITPDSLLWTGFKNQPINQRNISVYPNPADNYLTIELSKEGNNSKVKFELRDMIGKLIFEKEFSKKHEALDVSELVPGIYFYTILRDNKVHQSDKLIIN